MIATLPSSASAHTGSTPSSWASFTNPGAAKTWRDPKLQVVGGSLTVGTAPQLAMDVTYGGGCGTTTGLNYSNYSAYGYYVNASGGVTGSAGFGMSGLLSQTGGCGTDGVLVLHNGSPSTANVVPSGTTNVAFVICVHTTTYTATDKDCTGATVGLRVTSDVNAYPNSGIVLSAAGVCDGITLSWTYTGALDRFDIQRSSDAGTTWTSLETVGGSLRSYVDSPVRTGAKRWYRIRASQGSASADWSNVVNAEAGCPVATSSPSPTSSSTPAPSSSPSATLPGARYLTCHQAASLVIQYLTTEQTHDRRVLFLATFWAESSLNYHAVSYDGSSYGWIQINVSVWNRTITDMFDPVKAIQQGDAVNASQGITAWDAYNKGMHTKFMDKSEECVDWVLNNGVVAPPSGSIPDSVDPITDPDTADENGEGGVSCGWSIFCYIKKALAWAFVPGTASENAWNSFAATVEDRPPASLALAVDDWLEQLRSSEPSAACNFQMGCPEVTPFKDLPGAGSSLNGYSVDGLGSGSGFMTVAQTPAWQLIRTILSLGLWAMFLFACWRRAQGSFGSNTQPDPAGAEA